MPISMKPGIPRLNETFRLYSVLPTPWHLRIILKRFANQKEWEEYWKKLFGDDFSVILLLRNLKGHLPKMA